MSRLIQAMLLPTSGPSESSPDGLHAAVTTVTGKSTRCEPHAVCAEANGHLNEDAGIGRGRRGLGRTGQRTFTGSRRGWLTRAC